MKLTQPKKLPCTIVHHKNGTISFARMSAEFADILVGYALAGVCETRPEEPEHRAQISALCEAFAPTDHLYFPDTDAGE